MKIYCSLLVLFVFAEISSVVSIRCFNCTGKSRPMDIDLRSAAETTYRDCVLLTNPAAMMADCDEDLEYCVRAELENSKSFVYHLQL